MICLAFEQIAFPQYYLKTKSDSTVLEGDSVLLSVDGYRGTIIWQASNDLTNWIPLNEIKDTLTVRIDSTAYYRAVITEGTCEPVMSDTVKVIEEIIETYSNQFTVDSEGGIFLLPSGIKVKIPKGAVIEPKEMRLDILSIEDVNTFATVSNSDNVTFLTGISIATDLFDFKEPIKVKIPIQNIDEDGYPFLYELINESNTWIFSDETKIVNPKDKYIEIILKESDQTTNTLQTKSKLDLNDVRSFFLELYGDIFLSEDECRKIVAKIETTHLDDFSKGECNIIRADEQFNYFACDPPQSDAYVAVCISESCEPELKISPEGVLLLKKDETAKIALKTFIGRNYPLTDQEIKIRTSGNLLVTTPLIFTDHGGDASFDVKALEEEGKGKIHLSVSFKYSLNVIHVNVGGNIEENEEYPREVKLDTTINVIIYNDCTHPDELDCSSIANPNCPAIKETLIDEIVLIKATSEIEEDESFLMELEAYNYLGVKLGGYETIWSSSDESKVTVNNGLITGVEVGEAIISAQVCDLIIQYKVEVINTYELTWKFNAYWAADSVLAELGRPPCSVGVSGDGFWEGSAVIEEHVLGSEKFYEITSLSCDGLIQGQSDNSLHGWIRYTNSFQLDMEDLEAQILESFELDTIDGVKYMVDPFKKSGSAYPLNFLGLHEGSFSFYNVVDEDSYATGDYSFEDAWGALISPTTIYYTSDGYPFQIPQNDVTVFSNDDSDIQSDDTEGNSYSKSLQHLYAGVFDFVPGYILLEHSALFAPVYCDVEIKLVRISTQ